MKAERRDRIDREIVVALLWLLAQELQLSDHAAIAGWRPTDLRLLSGLWGRVRVFACQDEGWREDYAVGAGRREGGVMGDMGDDFRAMKAHSQEKRARNREYGAKALREAGVPFESKNDGAHLIVKSAINYWPGTGLWSERSGSAKGRGIKSLLKHVGVLQRVSG